MAARCLSMAEGKIKRFQKLVWEHHRKWGRHDLPWRKTRDSYRILVSEVMLQQTQVERVLPFYKKFLKQFPTAKRLTDSPLSDVLKAWQGLGYNRRAKMLHAAAKELAVRKRFSVAELEALPGIGPYTARAVAAFAYNEDVIFVETNIRTAVIHHFFAPTEVRKGARDNTIYGIVSDLQIKEVLVKALPKGNAREWYSALMDYGAYLKRSGVSHNLRSSSYAKQSKFSGSLREARGALLRELSRGPVLRRRLTNLFGADRKAQVAAALEALLTEGFIEQKGKKFSLTGDALPGGSLL